MNENILDALMRLFALIIDPEDYGNIDKSRDVVSAYLSRTLSPVFVEKYLERYDGYINSYKNAKNKKSANKRISSSSVRVLKICALLNQELHQKEKFYVLVRIIEYISIGGVISQTSIDFIQTIAVSFNIENFEFKNIMAFVENDLKYAHNKENFLYIDNFLYF